MGMLDVVIEELSATLVELFVRWRGGKIACSKERGRFGENGKGIANGC